VSRRWMIPPLAAGAVVGLALGVGLGYFGRAPIFGGTVFGFVVIPLAVGTVASLVLSIAALRGSARAGLALAGMWLAGAVGIFVAPPPPGSLVGADGWVKFGSEANTAAYFEGEARCEWAVGDPYVGWIGGFSWHVDDPALQETLDLAGPRDVERIFLGTGARPIGADAMLEFAQGQSARSGSFTPVPLVTVATDGRTGTARSADGTVVVTWECDGGPGR
jgi:hypothetical protein